MSLLSIKNLKVYYYTLSGIVRAVDGVSMVVSKGEWFSVVGESGSGKSTLAYSIINLVPPPGRIVEGEIVFNEVNLTKAPHSVIRRVRGREIGFVFQDPMTSLDPLRTVGSQIKEVIEEHGGASGREVEAIAKEAFSEVGLSEEKFYSYPHQLSGGQRQRVAIAIATVLKPKLLIADEPTTALDVIVQRSIMEIFWRLKSRGMSIVLVTHDLALASEWSDRIAVMYAGELVEIGPTRDIIEAPLHPYTQLLVKSTPDIQGDKALNYIPGEPPDLKNPPSGCRFHPRCPYATEICRREAPKPTIVRGRIVSCHLLSPTR